MRAESAVHVITFGKPSWKRPSLQCRREDNTKKIFEKKQVVKTTHLLDWLRIGFYVEILM
jgi:hypothetical protein